MDDVSGITASVDTSRIKELGQLLSKREFNKVILKAMRNANTRIKRKTEEEITGRYNISHSQYTKHVRVATEAHGGDALRIIFRGKRMRLATFAEGRGAPIRVRVKDQAKDMDRNTFIVGMHKKAGGDWRLGKHIERHATKTDKVDMMFHRETEKRYPITALMTLSIPNAIGNEEVSSAIQDFAADQLDRAAMNAINKAFKNAAKSG